MKKINFIMFSIFMSFIFISSTKASTIYGGFYQSNEDRTYQGLNLIEELSVNSAFSDFYFSYHTDLITKLRYDATSNGFSLYSKSYNSLALFNVIDLLQLTYTVAGGPGVNYAYNKCIELNCSYVFMSYFGVSISESNIEFNGGGSSGYLPEFFFYDQDMNFLSYNTWTSYMPSLNYDFINKDNGVIDVTSMLNVFLDSHFNDYYYLKVSSNSLGNVALQYVYTDEGWSAINSEVGKGLLGLWWERLWSSDINGATNFVNSGYNILNDYYYKYYLISDTKALSFTRAFVKSKDFDIPENYESISLQSNLYGYYLKPTGECNEESYTIYYYSPLVRANSFEYIALDSELNTIYGYFNKSPNPYVLYKFSLLDDSLTEPYYATYYFKTFESSQDFILYYDSTCFSKAVASTSYDVSIGDTTYTSAFTNQMLKTHSINQSPTTNGYFDPENPYGDSSTSGSINSDITNSGSSLGNIINNSYNNLTGFFSTVTSTVKMISSFLLGLPADVYSVLIMCFTIGIVVLILKLFL
ncbi:MAG: hypothetical protein ACI4OT_00270 [Bacilli bacterium]